jgi:putative addiction module component (TIGR02574 family)
VPVSKTEILKVLPTLDPQERQEILDKLLQLEGEGWLASADLTDQERQLIESRIAVHRQNPEAAIPWDDVEAKLIARFGK